MRAVDPVDLAVLDRRGRIEEEPGAVAAWSARFLDLRYPKAVSVIVQIGVQFAVHYEPLLGVWLISEVAVVLRHRDVFFDDEVVRLVQLLLIQSLLHLSTHSEESKRKLFLDVLDIHLLIKPAIALILGHEVLDCSIQLTSEELDSEYKLVVIQAL